MPDDIFAAIANGFKAMGEKAEDVVQLATSISRRTAQARSGLERQERTKELLDQIEQRQRILDEAHRTLDMILKKLTDL